MSDRRAAPGLNKVQREVIGYLELDVAMLFFLPPPPLCRVGSKALVCFRDRRPLETSWVNLAAFSAADDEPYGVHVRWRRVTGVAPRIG